MKPNSQTFFWLPPSHSTWVFCEHFCGNSTSFLIDPWNFHALQNPWKFHVSSTPVTCLAWIFSGIAQCFWYVFTLYWVVPVLFSSSRAVSHISKTTNIGMLTFLLPFSRQEIHKKSTKNKGIQCALTHVVLVKNSWNKK